MDYDSRRNFGKTILIPELLRSMRKKINLTQKQVAEILGVSERAYQHYESGDREIGVEALIKIADFGGFSVDWIMGRTNNPFAHKIPFEMCMRYLNILDEITEPEIEEIVNEIINSENTGEYLYMNESSLENKHLSQIIDSSVLLTQDIPDSPELKKLKDDFLESLIKIQAYRMEFFINNQLPLKNDEPDKLS